MGKWKSYHKDLTKDEISNDLLRVYKEHQYINRELYAEHGMYSYKSVVKKFGSFTQALKDNNISYKRKYKHYQLTDKEILNDIIKVYRKVGAINTHIYYLEGKYKRFSIEKHFGSFANAIDKANEIQCSKLSKNSINKLIKLSKSKEKFKDISVEQLWDDIIQIVKEHKTFNTILLKEKTKFPTGAYLKNLGNISEICQKLNIIQYYNNSSSHIGKYCGYLIANLLKSTPEYEKTFDWLIFEKNKQKRKLKIDIYFEEYKLAIEYHGIQHYQLTTKFDSHDSFLIRQKRDNIKRNKLKEHGITLIEIKYDEPLNNEHLLNKLIENKIIKKVK